MARLKFLLDEEGKPTKEALRSIYSKDREYVDFDKACVCVGGELA